MLIKDLKTGYPFLYEKAIIYSENKGKSIKELQDINISAAFDWSSTIEGHTFWSHVNKGNMDSAKELRPDLFEDYIKKGSPKRMGLWG